MVAPVEEYHPPVEEYLTTIYELGEDGITVIQARLVERLGYSAPAVWEMVGRLKKNGYLTVDSRTISLTTEGRALAEQVVRKHRLAERLLTDIIGLPWHKAHLEAGRWEHVISDEVADLLAAKLQDPSTCPHGNPIPGGEHDQRVLVLLSEVEIGTSVRLSRVTETVEIDSAAMNYLNDNRFITGCHGVVTTKGPDGSMSVEVDSSSFALGPALAGNLYVELV